MIPLTSHPGAKLAIRKPYLKLTAEGVKAAEACVDDPGMRKASRFRCPLGVIVLDAGVALELLLGMAALHPQQGWRRVSDSARGRAVLCAAGYAGPAAKDEGVCFEIGYDYASEAAILLISTDFFDVELPNGQKAPLDPLLCAVATRLIRQPHLTGTGRTFREALLESRARVMQSVRTAVQDLLGEPEAHQPRLRPAATEAGHRDVFLDFGGTIYEWQELLQDELERMVQPKVEQLASGEVGNDKRTDVDTCSTQQNRTVTYTYLAPLGLVLCTTYGNVGIATRSVRHYGTLPPTTGCRSDACQVPLAYANTVNVSLTYLLLNLTSEVVRVLTVFLTGGVWALSSSLRAGRIAANLAGV